MTVLNSDIHGLNDDNHCDVISLLGTVSGNQVSVRIRP